MADKHTPWVHEDSLVYIPGPYEPDIDFSPYIEIFDYRDWHGVEGRAEGSRIAALIVRAVNHHEELVKALKLVRKTCGGPENWNGETRRFLEATDAVLSKVEGNGHA